MSFITHLWVGLSLLCVVGCGGTQAVGGEQVMVKSERASANMQARPGSRGKPEGRVRVHFGKINIGGSCNEPKVVRVVSRGRRGLEYCYAKRLEKGSSGKGTVTTDWVIEEDGGEERGYKSAEIDGKIKPPKDLLHEVGIASTKLIADMRADTGLNSA